MGPAGHDCGPDCQHYSPMECQSRQWERQAKAMRSQMNEDYLKYLEQFLSSTDLEIPAQVKLNYRLMINEIRKLKGELFDITQYSIEMTEKYHNAVEKTMELEEKLKQGPDLLTKTET